jgi:protein-S-isoprenylcysteine O-methyltransferase Ste14
MLWRYLPLAGVVSLVLIAGVIRPLIQLRRYGTPGVFLFRGGPAQNLRDALFALTLAGLIAHAIAAPRSPRWARLLVAQDGAVYNALQIAGAVLIVSGIIVFATAQLNLGASWRIGIDHGSRPGVVSSGLYRFSRHPIFLGFIMVFAGYAAMLPTPLSMLLVAGLCIGFRLQAAAEEAYMLRTYGEAYRYYARRVGRFLPGLGKL